VRQPINILFTAAGRRVSLVREFKAALAERGAGGRVITADLDRSAPAHYAADADVLFPRCTSPDYIPRLVEICRREQVRLLVPLIDTELALLARHREQLSALGTLALVSSPAVIEIGGDKARTHVFFRREGVPTPRLYTEAEIARLTPGDLPLFVKPAEGSASIGACRVATLEELAFHRARAKVLLVQELVTGEEYTIDVYVDFQGVPRCAVPRRRLAVRAGEVSKGLTVKDPAIMAAALEICRRLPGAIGCITLQCFRKPDGNLSFIEINPRFGGGYPLAWHAGANFPRWILQELDGLTPDWGGGTAWRDNLAMLRYDAELIVDGERL
jgi:carbamoyl-phosphate synthase large subunit